MKHLTTDHAGKRKPSLHHSIKKMLSTPIQLAVNKNSLIINDINSELTTEADEKTMNVVIGNILNLLIQHTDLNCIKLSARRYNNEILIYIDSHKSFDPACNNATFERLQLIAEKIGGRITVVNYSFGPSIVFSFLNMATAA